MYRAAVSDLAAPFVASTTAPQLAVGLDTLSVADLAAHLVATITGLAEPDGRAKSTGVAARLAELGFIVGETVSVLHRGPGGREPIAVQVGDTVFALRRLEASCIRVIPAA